MKKKRKTSVKTKVNKKASVKVSKRKAAKKVSKPKKKTVSPKKSGLHGIGGWLLLPTLDFCLMVIIATIILILSFFLLASRNITYAIFMIMIATILAYLAVVTLLLEFNKKKEFKDWAILTIWVAAVYTILASLMVENIAFILLSVVVTIFCALIWTEYFKVSKRVKNTFTR